MNNLQLKHRLPILVHPLMGLVILLLLTVRTGATSEIERGELRTPAEQPDLKAEEISAPFYYTVPVDFPPIEVKVSEAGQGNGYVFVGYFNYRFFDLTTGYLLILDDAGEPVFYKRGLAVLDFKKQPNDTLTYFDPRPDHRRFYALDDTYATVGEYQAGNNFATDLHDLQILDNGHALLLVHDHRQIDMSALIPGGQPDATVVGCIVQELDEEGDVVFEWHSWDHIGILDAHDEEDLTDNLVRYIHCNAIEQDNDANLLLTSRHLDEVTKIDRQTGDIIWRLGGKQNEFTFTSGTPFFFPHAARRLENGNILLYDNVAGGIVGGQPPDYSRCVEYAIDEVNMEAIQVWEYINSPTNFAWTMGNCQRLENGNTMIGWGSYSQPILTEVTAAGDKVFELFTEEDKGSYRAFRFPWTGRPTWPPALVARSDPAGIKLIMSWNGATEVASYKIYAGPSSDSLDEVAVVARSGFETIYLYDPPADGAYTFQVMPVDKSGQETILSNNAIGIAGGKTMFMPLINKN